MKILAFEFSSTQRSVALVVDGQVRGRAQESGPQENRALSLTEAVLREAGLEREDADCLAIGLGPGSYAGIRSAIAFAQGWQLARGTKVVGISSVESIAAQARVEKIHGQVNIVIDAQRNEYYLACYEVSAAGCREVSPLRLANREEVLALMRAGEAVVGPDLPGGEAGRRLFPDAAMLGQLASLRRDFVPCEALEPIYLRETHFVKAPPPRIVPAAG